MVRSKKSPQALEALRNNLLSEAELSLNFLVLLVSSCIIATLGLLMNSAAVIIGAMIIAPLMLPLRGLALGALEADAPLLRQSLFTLGIGTAVAILMSGLVGGIFNLPASSFGSEIFARTQPNLADLAVALAAGGVSGFAKIRPQLSDALAGTAISVALMPPLCVVGIALSQGHWGASGGAFLLYLTNFLGITLACIIIFILGGYSLNPSQMRRALGWFSAMTSLLMVPLFISLSTLLRQKQLEAAIKDILQNQTITVGEQTQLVKMDVKWNLIPWNEQPSVVLLAVQAEEDVTAKQVREVEKFLSDKLQQPFKIVFQVSQFREVRSDSDRQFFEFPLLAPAPHSVPPLPTFSQESQQSSPSESSDAIVRPVPEEPTTNLSP